MVGVQQQGSQKVIASVFLGSTPDGELDLERATSPEEAVLTISFLISGAISIADGNGNFLPVQRARQRSLKGGFSYGNKNYCFQVGHFTDDGLRQVVATNPLSAVKLKVIQ